VIRYTAHKCCWLCQYFDSTMNCNSTVKVTTYVVPYDYLIYRYRYFACFYFVCCIALYFLFIALLPSFFF